MDGQLGIGGVPPRAGDHTLGAVNLPTTSASTVTGWDIRLALMLADGAGTRGS